MRGQQRPSAPPPGLPGPELGEVAGCPLAGGGVGLRGEIGELLFAGPVAARVAGRLPEGAREGEAAVGEIDRIAWMSAAEAHRSLERGDRVGGRPQHRSPGRS